MFAGCLRLSKIGDYIVTPCYTFFALQPWPNRVCLNMGHPPIREYTGLSCIYVFICIDVSPLHTVMFF